MIDCAAKLVLSAAGIDTFKFAN